MSQSARRYSALLLAGFMLAAGEPVTRAQQTANSVTLSGHVEDSTGGAIAGAQITLREPGGTVRAKTPSDAEGHFSMPEVPPGKYVLQAESTNFETVRIDVSVSAAQSPPELRIVLKVGVVSQTLTVEARGEYVLSATGTATKTDTAAYQTPLTVDTVTRALIQDQESRNLEQILQNVSAVQSNDSVAGWGAKTFQVRGFDLQNTLLQDGVRLPPYAEIEPATIDHVDVLKGAAAGLYGRIEPGGVINIATLKPQPAADYKLGLTFGPYGDVRSELDATGPITHDKTLTYRGILAYESADSYRDTVQTRHFTLSPALQWLPRSGDRIDFRFEYKNWRDTTDMGQAVVPVTIDPSTGSTLLNRLPSLPRGVYFGPSGNFYDIKTTQETATWAHEFGKNWVLKPVFVHYHVDQPGHEGGPTGWVMPSGGWGPETPTLANYYVGNPSNLGAHGSFAEIDLTGKFSTFRFHHNILASVEYENASNFYETWIYSGDTPTTIDVTHPVYQPVSTFYTSPASADPTYGYTGGNHWWSATLQDQVALTRRLRVLAGLRFDRATASTSSPPAAPSAFPYSSVGDSKFSPRVGISYDLLPWLAAYASYAEAFGGNSAALLYNGRNSSAETSRQWEAGLKGHWFGSRLAGELTYFDLRKQHIVVSEPVANFHGSCAVTYTDNVCLVQVGEVGSRGVEFTLTGRLATAWTVNLTYANLLARVLDSGDQNPEDRFYFPVGQRLAGIPRNSGSAWLNYQNKSGWSAGFGAITAGSRPFDQPFYQANATLTLPHYLLLNAVAGHQWKLERTILAVQLKLSNLTNTNAWEAGWASSGALPSEPRAMYGSLRFQFH